MADSGSSDEQSVQKKPRLVVVAEKKKKKKQVGGDDADGDMSDDSSCATGSPPSGMSDFHSSDCDWSPKSIREFCNFRSIGYNSNSEDDEMTMEEHTQYEDTLRKSGGYDAPYFINKNYEGLTLVHAHLCRFGLELCKAAKFAIQKHNRDKHTNYDFYDVITAMMQPCRGAIYYITFLAEDLDKIGEIGSVDLGSVHLHPNAPSLEPPPNVGPGGGPIVLLRAKVYVDVSRDEHGISKMKLHEFLPPTGDISSAKEKDGAGTSV